RSCPGGLDPPSRRRRALLGVAAQGTKVEPRACRTAVAGAALLCETACAEADRRPREKEASGDRTAERQDDDRPGRAGAAEPRRDRDRRRVDPLLAAAWDPL